MTNNILFRALFPLLLILLVGSGVNQAQAPLGTAFTYQGQLKQGGEPLTGTRDMRFGLWTAADGGTLIGGTLLERPGVMVTGGLFTVSLDFGAGAFDGGARWLDISVKFASGDGYATLAPRQPITPTPYALYSLSVPWSGITSMPPGAAGVPIGTVIDWWRPRNTDPLPGSYAICDGSTVTDAESPIYGMVLPDLTDRFVRGITNPGVLPIEGYTTGGADMHAHSVDLPNHTHSIDHNHGAASFWSGGPDEYVTIWYTSGLWALNLPPTGHWHQTYVDLPNHTATSGGHDPTPVASTSSSNVPAHVGLLKLCRIK
jgi:hypothetical protein